MDIPENITHPAQKKVLVTGGTGFIATWCIARLLNKGYIVNTTIRFNGLQKTVLLQVLNTGVKAGGNLNFFVASLDFDNGWDEAVSGCDYVLHIASPFPSHIPKIEEKIITPAIDGTLRVLKASREAGVLRVVITSSFAAVGYGKNPSSDTYNEHDWTNISGKNISAYIKSKVLAERTAWDFINTEGGGMELSVVNPAAVFGPLPGPRLSASVETLRKFMNGTWKACPRIYFNAVDVRDVADLHLLAMTNPGAKGERFLACSGNCLSIQEMAILLKMNLGEWARHVPVRVLPDWLVKFGSLFIPSVKPLVPELGRIKNVSNEKAVKLLNWSPMTPEGAILSTARSLIDMGLILR